MELELIKDKMIQYIIDNPKLIDNKEMKEYFDFNLDEIDRAFADLRADRIIIRRRLRRDRPTSTGLSAYLRISSKYLELQSFPLIPLEVKNSDKITCMFCSQNLEIVPKTNNIMYCKNNCTALMSLDHFRQKHESNIPVSTGHLTKELYPIIKQFFDLYNLNNGLNEAKINHIVLAKGFQIIQVLTYFNRLIESTSPVDRLTNLNLIDFKLQEIKKELLNLIRTN